LVKTPTRMLWLPLTFMIPVLTAELLISIDGYKGARATGKDCSIVGACIVTPVFSQQKQYGSRWER
jgi:hypothetical protein